MFLFVRFKSKCCRVICLIYIFLIYIFLQGIKPTHRREEFIVFQGERVGRDGKRFSIQSHYSICPLLEIVFEKEPQTRAV